MTESLRKIPSVTELLKDGTIQKLVGEYPRWFVVQQVRGILTRERQHMLKNPERAFSKNDFARDVVRNVKGISRARLKRVINCTGVIIHTNLGRAPLSESAIRNVKLASTFTNLEYDLDSGKRGSRYSHCSELVKMLTGAEDSLVVNNNAGALLLCLAALARKKEVVISRGEIVEIGGGFRINEILKASGSKLVEVGTTNKTRVRDYEAAVGPKTGTILKVHTSNFRIVGFQESASLSEIVKLARSKGVPLIYDAGSGLIVPFSSLGLKDEPLISEVLKSGADLVTFSGDKLLGGPQSGIIVGKSQFVSRLKKNPLLRALRVCKLTLSALEATLLHYVRGEHESKIPALEMINLGVEVLEKRARTLAANLKKTLNRKTFDIRVRKGQSYIGGGSYPGVSLESRVVAVGSLVSPSKILSFLRRYDPPIIARIEDDELLLDLRTILKHEFEAIENAFKSLSGSVD